MNRVKNICFQQQHKKIMLLSINTVLCLLTFGCGSSQASQCEQIFQIARQVTASSQNIASSDSSQPLEKKYWLEAASNLNGAAAQVRALEIDQSQLIGYQNQLAAVYQLYSQATYDAVRARENKNLAALEAARRDAVQAGKIQRELIRKINAFCLAE
ncbi:MAG: hypothetical protein AAFQ80_04770 [Cyanobacteria bacterium J06621_8]